MTIGDQKARTKLPFQKKPKLNTFIEGVGHSRLTKLQILLGDKLVFIKYFGLRQLDLGLLSSVIDSWTVIFSYGSCTSRGKPASAP